MTALLIMEYENRRVVFEPPFTRARLRMGVQRFKQDYGPEHYGAIDEAFEELTR